MTKTEFFNNISPVLHDKIDFKKDFSSNLFIASHRDDNLLYDFLKSTKFKYLRVSEFSDKDFLWEKNLSISIRERKAVICEYYKRGANENKKSFNSNEGSELFLTNFFMKDLKVNREFINSLIHLDYMLSVSQEKVENGRIKVLLEKPISKYDGKTGYLDMVIYKYEDNDLIKKKFGHLKDEEFMYNKENKNTLILEYKSHSNYPEKDLVEQCNSYNIDSFNISKKPEKLLNGDIFPIGKTYNNIVTVNIVFDLELKNKLEEFYPSLD